MDPEARAGSADAPALGGAGAGPSSSGLFVIQNPAAGSRSPERLRRRIAAALAARGVPFEHAYTEEPGHGAELVTQALADGFRHFLVAGGDGTVREAVMALAGSQAALGLLPAGTGNQLAANLGLPKGLERSISVALGGHVKEIDLGLINGRPFTSIAGAGFDARVVKPGTRTKRRFGYLAYVHAATVAVLAPRPAVLRVTVDGREIVVRGVGVEVLNMPGLTAPGLRRPVPIVPEGRMDDGKLDGCLLASETTRDCFSALAAILRRRYGENPRLKYFQGSQMAIDADPPLPVQADGELVGLTPFAVRVWPGSLRVLVPPPLSRSGSQDAR